MYVWCVAEDKNKKKVKTNPDIFWSTRKSQYLQLKFNRLFVNAEFHQFSSIS